jgi:hypothetical protein
MGRYGYRRPPGGYYMSGGYNFNYGCGLIIQLILGLLMVFFGFILVVAVGFHL